MTQRPRLAGLIQTGLTQTGLTQTRLIQTRLIGPGLIRSWFIHELPLLVLGSFAIGFNAGAFERAGNTRYAGRAGGPRGRRLIRAEKRVIDSVQCCIAGIIAGQGGIRLWSCCCVRRRRRHLRVESAERQIGLDRTRLPSVNWRLRRLLPWRGLISEWRELDVRIAGRLGRVLGGRRSKAVRVDRVRIEESRRLRVATALAIALP